MDIASDIQRRLTEVTEKIEESAVSSGRKNKDVQLIVVSKSQPINVIRAAIQAGVNVFGENYPEESVPKVIELSVFNVEWHMIGHLQSRKSRLVAEHFDYLQSLDSLKLAVRLNNQLAEKQKILPALLEFNIGGEESKSGWLANDESQWETLLPEVSSILALKYLDVQGLMTMPPLSASIEEARGYFQKTRALRDYLTKQLGGIPLHQLSMGTSSDYPVAIEEGATMVRIGTAILGSRPVVD
jgi:pyridoxal phosphate enzyme (YggS family)